MISSLQPSFQSHSDYIINIMIMNIIINEIIILSVYREKGKYRNY